jgi:biotin-dependent carboxylase-like uncharacterized protein
MIRVIKAGLQTTIQSQSRVGLRHMGVPASGAADPLSLALANRLVGNHLLAPALEVTLSGVSLQFESAHDFALAGAPADSKLNGTNVSFYETQSAAANDILDIDPSTSGTRIYIAFGGGLVADEMLGSTSTYLPASLGGFEGRALQRDDRLNIRPTGARAEQIRTPEKFRPPMSHSWTLRACLGGESASLAEPKSVFDTSFTVGNRADRMGMALQGDKVDIRSEGRMPSAPVFPGTVQCPESGQLFLLSVDAQTTGGYPRVAQVIRADRHLLGQIRPGDRLRLLLRDEQAATLELTAKANYWKEWLPDISRVFY